jgi:hypothetical protein
MPAQYLILRQTASGSTVTFCDHDAQRFETLFAGGRWAARRFLRTLRADLFSTGKLVAAFCEKQARGNNPPVLVEIPFNKL